MGNVTTGQSSPEQRSRETESGAGGRSSWMAEINRGRQTCPGLCLTGLVLA
jgi:hypothetical protein